MRYMVTSAIVLTVSMAWSQDPASLGSPRLSSEATAAGGADDFLVGGAENQKAAEKKVINPFKPKPSAGGGMEGMDMGMGMGGAMGEMEAMGGMDDMMGDMEMSSESASFDQRFRRGLARAIEALKRAKSESEKEALRGYVREAFEDRYTKMIANRKRDLERLKQSVAKLEGDLQRREAAKDRVVQVQMQSVQLAAEGLLELGELQGVGGSTGIAGGGFSYESFGPGLGSSGPLN